MGRAVCVGPTHDRMGHNPLGVGGTSYDREPRVAAERQPWAMSRNPVGVSILTTPQIISSVSSSRIDKLTALTYEGGNCPHIKRLNPAQRRLNLLGSLP